MEELIDIYDADRVYTGMTIPRSGAFLKKGEYMLYVLAIVENAEGKYLITQRALDKSWGAGWWEVPGGGVAAGESSAQAVIREVREEVGLDVSKMSLEPVYKYTNEDLERGDNYIVDIYRFQMDIHEDNVVLQESEAIACTFASREEIKQIADRGEFLHYSRICQALESGIKRSSD